MIIFAVPMLKSISSRFGYNIGVTIAEGSHEYGSARNYVTFCGTYVFSFDKDDLRRDMTCVPYKYDKNLNQEYDMGIAGMGARQMVQTLYAGSFGCYQRFQYGN